KKIGGEEDDTANFESYKRKKYKNLRKIEKKIKRIIEKKEVHNNKDDKSIKKSIDLLIYPCIYEINKNENYFTSSCCSGRTVIFGEVGKNDEHSENSLIDFESGKKLDKCGIDKNSFKKEKICTNEIFLSYLKQNFIINRKEQTKKHSSDNEKCRYKWKGKNVNDHHSLCDCKGTKMHKKKVHIYYSCHMHQNLEHDANKIRKI
ncbi:Methyltransferase TYW3, putative, partial [Plasmodium malariae]